MLSSPRGLIAALAIISIFVSTTASWLLLSPSRSFLPLPGSPRSSLLPILVHSFSLFSLSLSLFPAFCRSSRLFFLLIHRDDDQTSAITLLLFAFPSFLFLVIFRLRSFCSYLPFAKTSTRYRRRGSERSLQLQSGAMHSRGASTRRNVRWFKRGMW